MSTHDENGNGLGGERATVALVNAKVATVQASVDGLSDLIRSEFKDVQRQLAPIESLSAQIAGLHERQIIYESRMLAVEKEQEAARQLVHERHRYRLTNLPSILTGLGLLVLAVVQFFFASH